MKPNPEKKSTTKQKIITPELLKSWSPCIDGYKRFCELMPKGATTKAAIKKLKDDGHESWAIWLSNKAIINGVYLHKINFEIAKKDLGVMTWNEAKEAAEKLGDGWRLPTLEELNLMYVNIDNITGLNLTGSDPDGWYWSSTPLDINRDWAWCQQFHSCGQYYTLKDGRSSVRLVR